LNTLSENSQIPARTSPTRRLSNHDQAGLDERISSRDVQRGTGYYTEWEGVELAKLGFNPSQRKLVPAMVIPIHGVDTGIVGHQIKPLKPRKDSKGKPRKYELPQGQRNSLHVSPLTRQYLGDPASLLS
jgi:hypothetical protein